MKENTNNNQIKDEVRDNVNDEVKNNVNNVKDVDDCDAETDAIIAKYQKEGQQRKVALLCSLMGNIFFLVTAYTILCYDGTGRLFGRLLGINL